MKFITEKDILDLNVMGYTTYIQDLSGCVVWTNPASKVEVYATPNFEEDGYIPFAYDASQGHGDVEHLTDLRLDDRLSKESQIALYIIHLTATIHMAQADALKRFMTFGLVD